MKKIKGPSRVKLSLQTTITLLVCTVVVVSLIITETMVIKRVAEDTKNLKAEKAADIARIVSRSAPVIHSLRPEKSSVSDVQAYTRDVQDAAGVEFIVVMDMKGIRRSHPHSELIGKKFRGGDEGTVLRGKEHISVAKGTLGTSLRAFAPVYDNNNRQIGAVAVGILLDDVNHAVSEGRQVIYAGMIFGIAAGIIGAVLLARKIKSILFGLEPEEIAGLLEERIAMLQSAKEGIIAVNATGRIKLVNKEGNRLLQSAGISGNPIGKKIDTLMPGLRLSDVLNLGEPKLDLEQNVNGLAIVTNLVPVLVKEHVVGAIATFRDRTELKELAEQLTGVKLYADALRSQSHEFMNKLHVISGLIAMKNYESVSSYIDKMVEHHQSEAGFISQRIKDPVLAGFLLGKLSYARENKVEFLVDGDGEIPESRDPEVIHELVVIVGNLINNAIEAVGNSEIKRITVRFDYFEQHLSLEVHDTGGGIAEKMQQHIFTKGFSTKGTNRGLGLFHLTQSLKRLNGNAEVFSKEGEGTAFIVDLPYHAKE
ncbi:CitB family two-component system sensor histidine kinase MalK [Peribacillus deserti]|uniref:histidine kinase n=1 Tax=Peribacillus deserti TaxID=673318 RepID=A0ABS2QLX1_9BACI|nr:DcuS/MalK family sensor histidine kinase [Peribacillus deserti]MBM7694179.1 CitB family two-component system sensor histidine kinase MalK [Peribacillus deserti]